MTHALLLVPLILAAAPAGNSPTIPDRWDAQLQASLPEGQVLAQKLVGDLDGDKKPEWVAIGRPVKGQKGRVSIAILAPPKKDGKPTLRFVQWWDVENATEVGAVIRPVKSLGNVVVVVAAVPDPGGDSTFTANIYAWLKSRKDFKPMVPERLFFQSQGGFAIEDFDKKSPGDELVAWTFELGEDEQLYDYHRYNWVVWRFDGLRFKRDDEGTLTETKFPDPAAAAKGIGLKTGDVRKTIPGIVGALP